MIGIDSVVLAEFAFPRLKYKGIGKPPVQRVRKPVTPKKPLIEEIPQQNTKSETVQGSIHEIHETEPEVEEEPSKPAPSISVAGTAISHLPSFVDALKSINTIGDGEMTTGWHEMMTKFVALNAI